MADKMSGYDLIGIMQAKAGQPDFNPHVLAKASVKQMHLFIVKLTVIRDASKSPEKRDKLKAAIDALNALVPIMQAGDLDNAIRKSDRSAMLFADVEMAQESVACVIAESTDPARAFWLVGSGGNGGVDVSDVVKHPKS